MGIEQYYFLATNATDVPVTVKLDRTCKHLGFIKHDGTVGTLFIKINEENDFIQLKSGESIGDKEIAISEIVYKAGTGETVAFRVLAFVNED